MAASILVLCSALSASEETGLFVKEWAPWQVDQIKKKAWCMAGARGGVPVGYVACADSSGSREDRHLALTWTKEATPKAVTSTHDGGFSSARACPGAPLDGHFRGLSTRLQYQSSGYFWDACAQAFSKNQGIRNSVNATWTLWGKKSYRWVLMNTEPGLKKTWVCQWKKGEKGLPESGTALARGHNEVRGGQTHLKMKSKPRLTGDRKKPTFTFLEG